MMRADVVVVGAGSAGRGAALAAARAGADVMLLDENPAAPLPGVRVRGRRLVWMVTPGFGVEALGPEGRESYAADRVVAATGRVPRLLPFPGWRLPGVGGFGDRVVARRIVLAGCGAGLAREARRLGGRVVAVPGRGQWIAGAYGRGRVERVRIEGGGFVAADAVLMGYGTVPRDGLGDVPGVERVGRADDGAGWQGLVAGVPGGIEICPCEGLSRAALETAMDEGAHDMNQLRAFTRCGMGACQGRLCGPAAAALLKARGHTAGVWTPRPPLRPLPLDALLGRFTYADIPVPPPAPL